MKGNIVKFTKWAPVPRKNSARCKAQNIVVRTDTSESDTLYLDLCEDKSHEVKH